MNKKDENGTLEQINHREIVKLWNLEIDKHSDLTIFCLLQKKYQAFANFDRLSGGFDILLDITSSL